jgi:two-component system, OmpR family, sensor histidine kinase ChvG
MKLHNQIIALSLLTLSLPWAGCEYIREMENTLRSGQEKNLLNTTNTIAHVLSYEDEDAFRFKQLSSKNNSHTNNIYAGKLNGKIILDGYADDWGEWSKKITYFKNQISNNSIDNTLVGMISAIDSNYFYLFFKVHDKQVNYRTPSSELINGDRLHISIPLKNKSSREYIIQTTAPGKISASYLKGKKTSNPYLKKELRIQGQWQDTSEGYNIELRIPVNMINENINFAIIDSQNNTTKPSGWYGTWDYTTKINNGLIILPSKNLGTLLQRFKQDDARLRVIDVQNWLLASSGSPYNQKEKIEVIDNTLTAILNQLYRFIMANSSASEQNIKTSSSQITGKLIDQAFNKQAVTSWYTPRRSNNAIVSSASPIIINNHVVAVVIADQSNDAILTLTNQALSRLISLSSIAIIIATAGMLGYMTFLSLRIRKLRNATEQIISPEGKLTGSFTPSKSNDELGDLSRSFYTMHQRLNEYTQYLKSLASKLSHELRTPLAIVQSSLDNLAEQSLDDQAKIYAQRALNGSERLSHIITAMSEANRVEQSIESSEAEDFDLCQIISSSIDAYKDTYKGRSFEALICNGHCNIHGSPELIIQMLDKLVDNAVDFSPVNSEIIISTLLHPHHVELIVSNEGPVLPDNMQAQLFDSMVSLRNKKESKKADTPHLGLGLFIAKLIVEAHQGTIQVVNQKDLSGVEFRILLPLMY